MGRPVAEDYKDAVEFVGLCDINPLRVDVARKAMGVSCPTFTNFDEMLDTEKPMVIDEAQCKQVLDAERRSGKRLIVTFNYRYAPKHQKVKELLMAGEIGRVTSVDFHWYLDTTHGAAYFRRWHRLQSRSGSLWVHKATHHFDLINWWLDSDPVDVAAFGSLSHYGKNGPFRHTHCRPYPHKGQCPYHWDITKDSDLVDLYGTKGRLEVRDYERQPWTPSAETEMDLRDLIFRGAAVPDHLKLPTSRAGAMSCLTGIAARKSCRSGDTVRIRDLVRI